MAAFTPPPIAPQRGDRNTFSARMDAFLTWLVGLIPQLNTFIANLNARDVGGANTFIFTFDAATTDTDPGPGKLRLGAPIQNTATVLRVDALTEGGTDVTAFLATLAAGTSNTKGSIRLQKVNDPAAWLLYDVTAISGTGGYRNVTVIPRSGSAPSPFTTGDSVALFIDRNGDKGDSGGTPTAQEIRDAVGTLPVENGGTGATTVAGIRNTLSINNVNNTSDANKPVSIAQQTALNSKMDRSGGTVSGNLVFPNGNGLRAFSSNGTERPLLYVGPDSVAHLQSGGGGVAFENSAGGVVASISELGAFSAKTVTETSDERKKRNWIHLTDAQLDALADMDLVGVFDWVDASGQGVGGSAQQIAAIVPQAVYEDAQGDLSVHYGGLNFAIAQGILRRQKASQVSA